MFTGFLVCTVLIFFFPYITIVIILYGTTYEKKKKKVFWFQCLQHISIFIYFFAFGFCVYCVFSICIVLAIFFSYITIVVNLYGTAHGKNNQLYNYFCFWFLCLQHMPVIIIIIIIFFCFWFLCLKHIPILFLLLNLYCTRVFQFIHNRILNKTHKKYKYTMHFKKGILGI